MPIIPLTTPVAEIIAKGTATAGGANTKNIVNVFHYMALDW